MKFLGKVGLLLSLLMICAPSFGQHAGASIVDPNSFMLPDLTANMDTKPVSLRAAQTLDPAVRNLVLIIAGQSNVTNIAPSVYTPSNPTKIDNLNIFDGGIYNAIDPALGTSLNTGGRIGMPGLRLADNLITANLFDRIVMVPIAQGGTAVADWETGFCSDRIAGTMNRLRAKGIVAGTNVTIVMLWGQGESDNTNGTTQAAYTTSLGNVIAKSRTSGFSGVWFIPIQTWSSNAPPASSVSVPIQNAQAAIVNHASNIWAGPNSDVLINSACGGLACRQSDNIHFSDAGSASYAAAWQAALHAFGAPF